MKRLIILASIAVLAISVSAQSSEAKKYIKKYDVINIVRQLPKGSQQDFWNKVHANNKRVKELREAYQSNNKTLQETIQSLADGVTYLSSSDNVAEGYASLKNSISTDLGLGKLFEELPIRIIQSTEANVSMDPTGQMRINTEAIAFFTYQELLAVCAHEAAHHACAHVMSKAWKSRRKKKRNRFWAELETGLLVGAAAATAGYGIANGIEMKSANTILANSDIFLQEAYADADGATKRYKYRYSRDEEIEADIIAYRFMEYIGYGVRHWISAMRKLKHLDTRTDANKYASHPLTAFRLEILETLDSETMNRGNMYSRLIGTGKVTKDDIGSREEFIDAIKDKRSAKEFYHKIIESGLLTVEDIGTEKDFINSISADFWR